MKYLFYSLFCLTLGCKAVPEGYRKIGGGKVIVSTTDCQKIFKEIQKKWLAHKGGRCYLYNEALTKTLKENTSCFAGLTQWQIENLFGLPSAIGESGTPWYYSVYSDCNAPWENNRYYTVNVRFKPNETGTELLDYVKSIGFADNPYFGKIKPKPEVTFRKVEGEKLESDKPQCQAVFDMVREKWLVTEKGDCHPYDSTLIKILDENVGCFLGLSREEVLQLFGECLSDLKNALVYYVNTDCQTNRMEKRIYYIKFDFFNKSSPQTMHVANFYVVKDQNYRE